jgi:hypothetical protein
MSRRGRNREGDICAEKYYALVSTPATLLSPRTPTPLDKHKHPSAVICDTCVQRQGLTWCARAGSGEGRGGEIQQSVRDCRPPPEVDTSMWPARHCSHRQLPRSTIEGEDRRRGEERMRGCDEGMWTNGHPFIRLSGPPVVTVTVSVEILVSVGGRRTISCWNSCFE